jgi:hypothetical protein
MGNEVLEFLFYGEADRRETRKEALVAFCEEGSAVVHGEGREIRVPSSRHKVDKTGLKGSPWGIAAFEPFTRRETVPCGLRV